MTFSLFFTLLYHDLRSKLFETSLHPEKENVTTWSNTTSHDDCEKVFSDAQKSTIILPAVTFFFFGMFLQNAFGWATFSRMIDDLHSPDEANHSNTDPMAYSPLPNNDSVSTTTSKWGKKKSAGNMIIGV